MTDTVTKEQVEKVLNEGFDIYLISHRAKKALIDELFPPKFQPREGQYIAVWNSKPESPSSTKFKAMNGPQYQGQYGDIWDHARPLTVEEIT